MKGIISNFLIVLLVAANIFIGFANYNERKPKCMSDDCNRVRVSGSRYCHTHENLLIERTICLEATNRN